MWTKLSRILCAIFLFALVLAGCNSSQVSPQEDEWEFCRTIASEFTDDGWIFSFVYERMKEGYPEIDDHTHYMFSGVNLRYRFSPEYTIEMVRETGEKKYLERYTPRVLRWGSGSEAQKRDIDLIKTQILIQSRSVEEMLALDPGSYKFEELNKDMFFRLMRDALTGEPAKETKKQLYADKPRFSMLIEPAYIDGYRFQLAYHTNGMGYIQESYIDVIYQTGPEYTDYVQLSDLVEQGKADEKQREAFLQLQAIVAAIRNTDDFLNGAEKFEKLVIGDIDFSRLYQFMKDIDANEFERYLEEPVVFSLDEIPS